MENFELQGTEFTPCITFLIDKNHLEIKGFSRPEDVRGFYQKFIDWLNGNDDVLRKIGAENVLRIEFNLEYFNSASAKFLLDIFMLLKNIYNSKLDVNWYYEDGDEDMYETGEEFADALNLTFEFIEI